MIDPLLVPLLLACMALVVISVRGHPLDARRVLGLMGRAFARGAAVLWRSVARWPRPWPYKLLVLVCFAGAALEGAYILVLAPPPYAVLSAPAVAPPVPAVTVPLPPPTPAPATSPGSAATPTVVAPTPWSPPPSPPAFAGSAGVPAMPLPQTTGITFVVEPDEGVAPLLAFIGVAQTELDGEIYLLSDPSVEAALGAAAARGVRVRLLLEQHPYGGAAGSPKAAYAYLSDHGVQVAWGGPAFRFTHAKALVADDQRAWIGTMNWTPATFTRNRDFAAVVDDPAVVRATGTLFNADWAGLSANASAPGLVISPRNARATLLGLIEGAGYTIDIYAEEITDPQVVQDLVAAERRGVRVRVVYTGIGDLTPLVQAGAQVRRVTYPYYIHAKAIVVDGNRLFVGSENLSVTSLDRNREIGLLLRDRLAISLVEQPFAADLARGRDYLPSVAAPLPTPAATPVPWFTVQAWVTPGMMPYDAYPVLFARSLPGAICAADVKYSTGYPPVSFSGTPQRVGAGGIVRWGWHEMTKGDSGEVTVSCSYGGASLAAHAAFSVTH